MFATNTARHNNTSVRSNRRYRFVRAAATALALTTVGGAAANAATFVPRARVTLTAGLADQLSNLQLRPLVPGKRALLVLIENGGFPGGLPADFTVGVPTCASFKAPVGANIVEFITSLGNTIFSAAECLNPAAWSTVQVPVAQYVTGATNAVINGSTAASITAAASPKYDKVVVLQGTDFGNNRIRTELTALAPTYVVDIHMLAHGSNGSVSGGGGTVTDQNIRDYANIGGLNLRSVYQQNCFASSLNAAWLAAGAKAVNGSALINSMPLSYSSFLTRWLSGQSFNTAVQGSTADWTPFFTNVYHFVDLFTANQQRRDPAQFDLFGGLSAADELAESAMIVAGSNTSVSLTS